MAVAFNPLSSLTFEKLAHLTCGGCKGHLCPKVRIVAPDLTARVGSVEAGAAEFAAVAALAVKSCGHGYHTKCLASWLAVGNQTCPECRRNIKELHVINFIPNGEQPPPDLVGEVFHEEVDHHNQNSGGPNCAICLETLADKTDKLFKGVYYKNFLGANFHPECVSRPGLLSVLPRRKYNMGHVIQLQDNLQDREARQRQNQPYLSRFIRVIESVRVFFMGVFVVSLYLPYRLVFVPLIFSHYYRCLVIGCLLIQIPLLLIERCALLLLQRDDSRNL